MPVLPLANLLRALFTSEETVVVKYLISKSSLVGMKLVPLLSKSVKSLGRLVSEKICILLVSVQLGEWDWCMSLVCCMILTISLFLRNRRLEAVLRLENDFPAAKNLSVRSS